MQNELGQIIPKRITNDVKVIFKLKWNGEVYKFESKPFKNPERVMTEKEMLDLLPIDLNKYNERENKNQFPVVTKMFLIKNKDGNWEANEHVGGTKIYGFCAEQIKLTPHLAS